MRDIEWIFRRVTVDDQGCWIWTRSKIEGYGAFQVQVGCKKTTRYAHRHSWELRNGPIPKGMYACHRCDIRSCCNPDHIFVGTARENMQDAVQKHRISRGEHRPNSKFSDKQALSIIARAHGGERVGVMAKEYGVSHSCISNVVLGKTRRHLHGTRTTYGVVLPAAPAKPGPPVPTPMLVPPAPPAAV